MPDARKPVIVFMALGLAACRSGTGCDTRTETLDLVIGDLVAVERLVTLIDDGYDCQETATIFDRAGNPVGSRYVCTGCR